MNARTRRARAQLRDRYRRAEAARRERYLNGIYRNAYEDTPAALGPLDGYSLHLLNKYT